MRRTFFIKIRIALLAGSAAMAGMESAQASPETWLELAKSKRLADELQWHKLVHYQPKLLTGVESQADGADFFLAPNGKTSPGDELEATLRAFYDTRVHEAPAQHPQCKFPARLIWIQRKLSIPAGEFPQVDCGRWERFKAGLAPKSATLVFSSYFLDSPASTFGHTLLRLNKSPPGETGPRHELLDYGISYAAMVTTGNPILYSIFGLAGMFPGVFSNIPYYYKVREYNDAEARDLWEYDLALEPEELELLLAHLWELGSTSFDYFYLTENCSYHIFTALEAAAPRLHLTDRLPWWVIPSDTVKVAMTEPGFVTGVRFRPSVRAQFQHRLATLSKDERKVLRQMIDHSDPEPSRTIADESRRAYVLDTVNDLIDLRYFKDMIHEQSEGTKIKSRFLLARSRILKPSPDLQMPVPEIDRPDRGHGSLRMGASAGLTAIGRGLSDGVGRFAIRFAHHDLVDPEPGYPRGSQIEFMDLKFRYLPKQSRFPVDEFSLFRVTSLSPLSDFMKSRSWAGRMGAVRFRDGSCNDCLGSGFEGGSGVTVRIPDSSGPLLFAGLLEGGLFYSPSFDRSKWRPVIGPRLITTMRFTSGTALSLAAQWRRQFGTAAKQNLLLSGEFRAPLTTRFSLVIEGKRYQDKRWESLAGFYVYF